MMTLRIGDGDRHRVTLAAELAGTSRSAYVREALRDAVDRDLATAAPDSRAEPSEPAPDPDSSR